MFAHLIAVRRKDENLPLRLFAVLRYFGPHLRARHRGKNTFRHHHHLPHRVYHDVRRRHKVPAISPSSAARRQPPSARSCCFPQNLPTPWTVSTAGLIRSTRRRASIHGRRCSHSTPSARAAARRRHRTRQKVSLHPGAAKRFLFLSRSVRGARLHRRAFIVIICLRFSSWR